MVNDEIWVDVIGYEGLYKVSNKGNIYSVPRLRNGANGSLVKVNGRYIKQSYNSEGYKLCGLSKNGRQVLHLVHRVVANAFIPNPDNLPEVNHKDENKCNNCADNLEWCTRSYNKTYKDNAKIAAQYLCKKVVQYTLGGQRIREYNSILEAVKLTGIYHIGDCCHSYLKQSGGFIWRFKDGS